MAFNVNLYAINKKDNSTRTPIGTGTVVECVTNTVFDILNPTLPLRIPRNVTPSSYNYVYIANLNRYYFINTWTLNNGLWEASCTVDALASWKTEIGNQSLYVVRSASAFDGTIVDEFYPGKGVVTQITNTGNALFNLSGGTFIVGVQNDYGLTFYQMTASQFSSFASYFYSNGFLQSVDLDGVLGDLNKAYFNPLQYVTHVFYCPVSLDLPTGSVPVRMGWWSTSSIGVRIPTGYYWDNSVTLTVPKHPQQASRGTYLNLSPYSTYTLELWPFGRFELDSTALINHTSITCNVRYDVATGQGYLSVNAGATTIAMAVAQVGVPLSMSQVTTDVIGGVTSLIGGLASMSAGSVVGYASGVGNAVKSMAPQISTLGSTGSYAALSKAPAIYGKFIHLVDDDLSHHGRPLCQTRTINTLSGYIEVSDADIEIACTKQEQDMIRGYLEGGFYYE